MKNPFNYRNFAIILIAAGLNFTAFANEGNNPPSSIEFKHVGKSANRPLFELKLNNTEAEDYLITFRDELGNVLYSERFSGSNISQRFSFNTEEIGDSALKLEVKSLKTRKSELFVINRTQSVIEQTVVNRVK